MALMDQPSVLGLRARSITDALADALREQILSGQVAGGTLLPEVEVATRYGVARPTAKAAIEKLVVEGLLRRDAHKTARVPRITVDDIDDLYYSREVIERDVMRTLAGRGQVPTEARAALRAIQEVGNLSTVEIVAPDVAFHTALVDALRLPRLSRLYGSLMGEMRLCMAQVQSYNLLSADVIAREHGDILAAIESGEPERAAESLTSHLERARIALRSFMDERQETGPAG
jgi:DNA-binding GntR family transcriptional regulator